MENKFKPLQLYLEERLAILDEIESLKSRSLESVTYFDFEGFKKAQKVAMENFMTKTENYIE